MPDHIHIFIAMKPTCCLTDLVREIKKASNLYINEKKLCLPNFNGKKDLAHFHIANLVYGM
jgi:REP element-mobilizing transposase RayT